MLIHAANYFNMRPSLCNQKANQSSASSSLSDDEKDDAKLLSTVRLVVGGLLLPTIAISIDKFFLRSFHFSSSTLIRTTIVSFAFYFCCLLRLWRFSFKLYYFFLFQGGLVYIGVKGLTKIFLKKKKNWQQANREIQNYKC